MQIKKTFKINTPSLYNKLNLIYKQQNEPYGQFSIIFPLNTDRDIHTYIQHLIVTQASNCINHNANFLNSNRRKDICIVYIEQAGVGLNLSTLNLS